MAAQVQPESQIILFIILTLIIGFVCKVISKNTFLPYTPLLILFGLLLRASDLFWDTLYQVQLLNPHAILVIFIPILIFESSINSHIEIANKIKYQVLLLVFPGVILTILMLAFSLKDILGYGDDQLTWFQASLLGTILSTTDPVAVVAILKELGAPLHISTLIEMESLFNDGTALLFFGIFSKQPSGTTQEITGIAKDAFSLVLGGCAIGLLFGFGCRFIFKTIKQSMITFICITITAAYSLFFICESFNLKINGFIGLAVLGLSLNNTINAQTLELSKKTLASLQYFIETILFLLSGVFMGSQFLSTNSTISYVDWLKMIMFFQLVLVSRVIMVALLYYPLQKTGEGFDIKKAIITSWSGLRGAISLSLAMIVHLDDSHPIRARDLIIFNTVGVSFLTMLINGTTCGTIIKLLKIQEPNDYENQFENYIINRMQSKTTQKLNSLKYDLSYNQVSWNEIETKAMIQQLDILNVDMSQSITSVDQFKISKIKNQNQEKIIPILRHQLLAILYQQVKQIQKADQKDNIIYDIIMEKIESSKTDCKKQLKLWNQFSQLIIPYFSLSKLKRYQKNPIIGIFIRIYINYKLEFKYELACIIQQSIKKTIKCLNKSSQINVLFNQFPQIKIILVQELEYNFNQARNKIEDITLEFPTVASKLKQRKAMQKVLMKQIKIINDQMGLSFLSEQKGEEMKLLLYQKIDDIFSFYSLLQTNKIQDIEIDMCQIFKNYISVKEYQDLINNSKDYVFHPQQNLLQEGLQDDYLYIIKNGKVEEIVFPQKKNQIQKFNQLASSLEIINENDDQFKLETKNIFMNDVTSPQNYEQQSQQQYSFFKKRNSILPIQNDISQVYLKQKNNKQIVIKEESIIQFEKDIQSKQQSQKQTLGAGSLAGIINLVSKKEDSLLNIIAVEVTVCKVIKISTIQNLLKNNILLQEYIYKRSLLQLIYIYQSNFGQKLIELGDIQVNKLIEQSEFINLQGGEDEQFIKCKYGGFIFSGQLKIIDSNQTIDSCTLFHQLLTYFVVPNETKLVIFRPKCKILKRQIQSIQAEAMNNFNSEDINSYGQDKTYSLSKNSSRNKKKLSINGHFQSRQASPQHSKVK